jgi:uncharacterized Ntn-hydrolase superfamily protein
MRVNIFIAVVSTITLVAIQAHAAMPMGLQPLAHTYSIVAYDPGTNQMGVAVQSHYFGVGPVVPWAEPGVGVVATQSQVEVSYGPLGLDLMRAGKTATETLTGLLAADLTPEVRQVAMIDVNGGVAVHTGAKCIPEAGDAKGMYYSCQANLMARNTVPDAMAKAFTETKGDLAHRMMAALFAAEGEGGDVRGKQSAALIVVAIKPTGVRSADYITNIRVDDSPAPLPEMARLLDVSDSYAALNNAAMLAMQGDLAGAEAEYARMLTLQPGNAELVFWYADTLLYMSQTPEALIAQKAMPVGMEPPKLTDAQRAAILDAALAHFRECFAIDPAWRGIIARLVPLESFPPDEALIKMVEGL